jgi:hypothetical protein
MKGTIEKLESMLIETASTRRRDAVETPSRRRPDAVDTPSRRRRDAVETPSLLQKQKQKQKQNLINDCPSELDTTRTHGSIVPHKNNFSSITQDHTNTHEAICDNISSPRALIPPSNRRDLDPELLEITSRHAQLWKISRPQVPSGDDRYRIQQAVLAHGVVKCVNAVKGHWLRLSKQETRRWYEVWWAFPPEKINGKTDHRKLNTGLFDAYAIEGTPKIHKKTPCQDVPEKILTPEERLEMVRRARAAFEPKEDKN